MEKEDREENVGKQKKKFGAVTKVMARSRKKKRGKDRGPPPPPRHGGVYEKEKMAWRKDVSEEDVEKQTMT